MQPGGTSAISLSKCNQENKIQKFKWTSSEQILNVGLKLCLGASANFSQLEFSSCNQTSELQKWECANDTFPAIRGQNWFLSYGAGRVQLNNGHDVKATWKIDGTKDSLCTKGFEGNFWRVHFQCSTEHLMNHASFAFNHAATSTAGESEIMIMIMLMIMINRINSQMRYLQVLSFFKKINGRESRKFRSV